MIACKFCKRLFDKTSNCIQHEQRCVHDPHGEARRSIDSGEFQLLPEPLIRRRVKQYLIAIHGHQCMMCETSEWLDQPVPLVCDHIDGDSTNNALDNFRNVCCNCDALLPTFKSKNRGSGRQYDREYKQKESYVSRRSPLP